MTLYSTKVTAIGGRHGTVRSEDGLLALDLAIPKEMGGKGGATNPEQLFAAGYAACFENAVIHITRNKEHKVADDAIRVVATISMAQNEAGGFSLSVALDVTIYGLPQQEAEKIVEEAHKVCPYSNAVRNNVPVVLTVSVDA